MDPTTPVLPTVIITHATPLPPVPRRSATHDSTPTTASTYISSFFASDPTASGSATRRLPEKMDHGLLTPYPYPPSRKRKTRRHQTAVQVGLLLIASVLLWTSTRWTDEWAGRGIMGLLMPNTALPEVLGEGILHAWNPENAPIPEFEEEITSMPEQATQVQEEVVLQTGKMGAMKVDEWKAYLANQQSMTGYAGPASTMEAWDFH